MGVLKTKESKYAQVDVTVVLPALNEVDIIEQTVNKISQTLGNYGYTYEIIVAEDGSTDGTDKKVDELTHIYSYVRHMHSEKRLGRGKALKNSFKQSNGNVLIYMDVDLATNLKYLNQLIRAVTVENYSLATGSRMLFQSKVERSVTRKLVSKTYNFMVRLLLKSVIKDHQCGFKAFQREILLSLLDEVNAAHWFWDTELFVRAQRKGYKIKEIPVEWKSMRKTKVNLFKDSLDMGWQVIILWLHLNFQF
ncbi:MAG: glycosyltransferase family 2 protein [Candidatus Bathyarchaeota archaeon]|nr:glycosyltransferase family 2 protein [Candidatus Termiticorpusculum sp.]